MSTFLGDDFLLTTPMSRTLYHEYAAGLPIFDYHCHLPPNEIADDRRFENMTRIWLAGDHYKWRAMRTNGVDERLITGDAPDREKFQAWADTVPATIGNPLYHWTHLELARPFGIVNTLLNGSTADSVWQRTGDMLSRTDFSARGIIRQMNVRFICTTDDPTDDLAAHQRIRADDGFDVVVVPAFRPDKGVHIEYAGEFRDWVSRLEAVCNRELKHFDDLLEALEGRIDYFHELGARISDHAVEVPPFREASPSELDSVYQRVYKGGSAGPDEALAHQTAVLQHLGRAYARRGWVMQLHISALRNNSTRGFRSIGPDSGFDSIGDEPIASPLNRLLNSLDYTGELPRTILYTLNAGKNDVLASTIGNFQDGTVAGKMQFGSGWWFHDQLDGMKKQMTSLANLGLLSRFVGMLTDSRSFLSFPRHDYFRRLLCDMLGELVESGQAPRDEQLMGEMVKDICWNNAVRYFGYDLEVI